MIRFTLSCENVHSFESWFKSNEACEELMTKGLLNCETCGSTTIRKSLMTPSVALKSQVQTPIEKLRREVEANSEYVGTSFAKRAREMHEGTTPDKPIYGEANAAEAKALIADGIPVLPLPFIPTKKVN